MPDITADPPDPSCLLSSTGIVENQGVGPDPFSPRARDALGRFAKGSSGNPRGRPRHPQSQAARARSCDPAAKRAGAVGSARPQAPSAAAARRAIVAAAPVRPRSGRTGWDRPVVGAHGGGLPADAEHRSDGHCARRDRARRGCAHRPPGACPVARPPPPRTIAAPAAARNASGHGGGGPTCVKYQSRISSPVHNNTP
jgi:hypothetical protein